MLMTMDGGEMRSELEPSSVQCDHQQLWNNAQCVQTQCM